MTRSRDQIPELVVLGTVLAIAAIASYIHLRAVWEHAGAPVPALGPLLVDGLFAAAWLRMRRRRRQEVEVGLLAWLALALALVATVAGNLAAAWIAGHRDLLSLVVAAWPAVAFALVWELVTGHRGRAPATAEDDGLAVDTPDEVVEEVTEEAGLPFAATGPTPVWTKSHVYRLYDAADQLLYVGIAQAVPQRVRKHKQKEWWPDVVRGSVTTYRTRRDALAAEAHAIDTEGPRYNVMPGSAVDRHSLRFDDHDPNWTPSDPVAIRENIPAAELHAPMRGGDMADDRALADRVVRWSADEGAMPSRERVRLRFNIGSRRADRIRALATDMQGSAQPDPGPDPADSSQLDPEEATG